MRLTKELWWTLWGVGIALMFQVLYDAIGVNYPDAKIYGGIIIGCVIILGLILTRPIQSS